MDRRTYLAMAASGSSLVAGCSQVEQLANSASNGKNSLGDTVTFGEIDVTVSNAMTSDQITINGNEKTAPSNGIYALFEIESHNTDVTDRDGPHVSITHYDTLEKEDSVIYSDDINDIRVYGSDDPGHFPDLSMQEENQINVEFALSVPERELEAYPTRMARPSISADETASGWTVGVIKTDQTPQLKIQYNDNSAMWTAKDADLSSPESE